MSKRRQGTLTQTPDLSSVLRFSAALAGFGRRAITLDAEGECILALQIPASDAPALIAAYELLLGRSFEVTVQL